MSYKPPKKTFVRPKDEIINGGSGCSRYTKAEISPYLYNSLITQ